METRALCIAFLYAIGTAAGGIAGPLYFGGLIEMARPGGHHRPHQALQGGVPHDAERLWRCSSAYRQSLELADPLTAGVPGGRQDDDKASARV